MSYGRGDIKAHIAVAWRLCQDAGIGAEQNTGPSYHRVGAATAKRLTYAQEWQGYIDQRQYDILLIDQSLVQFRVDLGNTRTPLSYNYYENPLEVLSYDDFLVRYRNTQDPNGGSFLDPYDDYLSSVPAKDHVMPIRYDFSPELYLAGSHPVSHIHMGHRNSIRLGTRKLLRPSSFVLFVLRQVYPAAWRTLLNRDKADVRFNQVEAALDDIDGKHFRDEDRKEMYLR